MRPPTPPYSSAMSAANANTGQPCWACQTRFGTQTGLEVQTEDISVDTGKAMPLAVQTFFVVQSAPEKKPMSFVPGVPAYSSVSVIWPSLKASAV